VFKKASDGVSWLIALIAIPVFILTHAISESDGMTGNQAKQGYMMYLMSFLECRSWWWAFLPATL